tara:strand:+ start:310 stop:654 length:345 start_codon:yes stop_codon:yes gene_type:complete
MAVLTAQQISQAGVKPSTVVPAAGGDTLKNTAKQFFWVQNTTGSAMTATVVPVVTTVVDPLLGTLKKENAVLSLAANQEGFIGPFEVDAFNDANGNITITCSVQTGIKLAALYL